MSWDIFIYSQDPRQLNAGAKVPPLGDAADVRAKISKSLPAVDWKDPAWGVLEGKGWSIEFYHQTNGVADSLMLLVRGGGEPVPAICQLCKENGWVALDSSTGQLMDLNAAPSKSWEQFQKYRDQVTGSAQPPLPPRKPNIIREQFGLFLFADLSIIALVLYLMWKRSGAPRAP
jgi:hypothetical protein